MKSKLLTLFACLTLTLSLTACHENDEPTPAPKGEGQVNLRSLGVDVNNAENVINTSTSAVKSRADVDLSDFKVTIYKGETAVKTWRYADMPELFTLEPGDYKVKVISHDVQKAEWEHPLFIGEKDFSITNDNITEIGIVTCYLSNIKVTIKYDDTLRARLGDDAKVTVIANDEGRLVFTPDETRSGYFEALEGSSTLIAEFTGTIGRNYETLRHTITDVQAGQHRIITFKIKGQGDKPSETGGISLGDGFFLDVDVVDENLKYNIDLEEDNIPDDRPKPGDDGDDPTPPGPQPGEDENAIQITSETLSFTEANSVDISEAIVKIKSENGIEHFLVKIETNNDNFLQAVSELMPTSFDLAYPGENAESFSSIGFPVGDEVIGAKDLTFDISTFVPLLKSFPGTHKFTLSVTDAKSINKIVSLTFVAN